MSTLEVRFDDVSGKLSLIVAANLADGWRRLGNNFGFYGFAHEEYQKEGLVTVRVWVIERSSQLRSGGDGFPLDLQSMGSSPSKALAFRLFHGRLSLGAAMSTVVNSRRNGGKPGFHEDAILIAQHGSVAYWLRFYAALNEEHPEPPEWMEHDLSTDERALSGPEQTRRAPISDIEERLARVSLTVDTLEGRERALVADLEGRVESSLQAFQGKGARQAEDLEKIAQELGGRWSQQLGKQAEAAVERLREELNNAVRMVEEGKQQLARLAEAQLASLSQAAANVGPLVADLQGRTETSPQPPQGKGAGQAEHLEKIAQELGGRWSQQFEKQAEAAVERLREELNNSGRAVEESKRQLASLANAKLASLSQVAANATAGLEAEQRRLKNQYETSRRELEDLLARRLAKLPPTSYKRGRPPRGRGMVANLALAAGLFLVITVPPLSVYLSTPLPVQLHLQAEAPTGFADQNPYWGATRRVLEEETAQAYWRAAVVSLQEKYPFGSELPADPPTDFQVDEKYAPPGGAKALAETRAHYWEKLRTSWGQRQFWVESQEGNEPWAVRLRRVWEQIKAKFA
jgi:flagellar biosynthesis chaperone FliJ